MSTIKKYAKSAEKYIVDNSPAILTGLGVAGTVTTAVLTGQASFKAAQILAEERKSVPPPYDFKEAASEYVRLTWRSYLPAVAVGSTTIACIICANRVENRRAAAVAAAYSLSERAFEEYRAKVADRLGEGKAQEIKDEIHQNRVKNDPNSAVVMVGSGKVLCYETYAGRYFESTMEDLKWAQNKLNAQVVNNYYASLNDFYSAVGLPMTDMGEELGWNVDRLLELEFSSVLTEESKPCLAFSFTVTPIRHYFRMN